MMQHCFLIPSKYANNATSHSKIVKNGHLVGNGILYNIVHAVAVNLQNLIFQNPHNPICSAEIQKHETLVLA